MFLVQALELNKIQVLCYVLVLNISIKEPGHIPKCKEGTLNPLNTELNPICQ